MKFWLNSDKLTEVLQNFSIWWPLTPPKGSGGWVKFLTLLGFSTGIALAYPGMMSKLYPNKTNRSKLLLGQSRKTIISLTCKSIRVLLLTECCFFSCANG